MNLTTLMKMGDNITSESPLSDRAAVGIQVVGIGMGVVFGVLILLIAILYLFKFFATKNSNAPEAKNPVAPVVAAPAPVQTAAVPASEEEKVVAIATAAIAAYRGESECSFNVISIKKIVK